MVLALPESLGEKELARLKTEAEQVSTGAARLVTHRMREPIRSSEEGGLRRPERAPWILFVDSVGVVRDLEQVDAGFRHLPRALRHWADVYRSCQSPGPCTAHARG